MATNNFFRSGQPFLTNQNSRFPFFGKGNNPFGNAGGGGFPFGNRGIAFGNLFGNRGGAGQGGLGGLAQGGLGGLGQGGLGGVNPVVGSQLARLAGGNLGGSGFQNQGQVKQLLNPQVLQQALLTGGPDAVVGPQGILTQVSAQLENRMKLNQVYIEIYKNKQQAAEKQLGDEIKRVYGSFGGGG